jgi:N-methylhydantoinase B
MAKNGPGDFDPGPERAEYEKTWTAANYDALTEVLAALPVYWRFYAKRRIFALVDAASDRKGDGSEVRAAFALLRAEFPQIAA